MNSKQILTAVYGAIAGLAVVEFFKYSGIVANYFSVQYVYIALAAVVGIGASRMYLKQETADWWIVWFNNMVVLPAALVLAAVLVGVESWNYTNYIFSTLGINHYILVDLIIFSFGFKMVTAPAAYLKSNWKMLLFFSFLLFSYYIYQYDMARFVEMSRSSGSATDDNFMEWLQVWVLGFGAIVSGALAIQTKKSIALKLVYALGILVFIFLIGEEISWGERIVDYSFDFGGAKNYQNEKNFHNQPGMNEISAFMYIVAFLYALGSWWAKRSAEQKKIAKKSNRRWWDLLCFKGQEVLYFVPTFLFNPYADRTLVSGYPPPLDMYYKMGLTPDFIKTLNFLANWREAFEVLFYAGLAIHLLQIYFQEHGKTSWLAKLRK